MRTAISYDTLQEYILDNDLTENDTIILHPADYDYVATEYITENNLTTFRPVEILGTRIVEDTSGDVKKNHIYVVPLVAS